MSFTSNCATNLPITSAHCELWCGGRQCTTLNNIQKGGMINDDN